jgi:hypothetical protein
MLEPVYHLSHSTSPFCVFFVVVAVLGIELRAFTLSPSTSLIFVKDFSR